MTATSLFYYNDKLGKSQVRHLEVHYAITGAVTVVTRPLGAPVLTTFSAIASQAVINDFLGTTDEFNYLAFDATSMGADAMGVIINMEGQASYLTGFEALCYSGTGGSTLVSRAVISSATLTNTTLATECALGAYGNMAFKLNWGNTPDFDALTEGYIILRAYWIAK